MHPKPDYGRIDTFLGRDYSYWAELDILLQRNGVRDLADLKARIEKPKRVEVYDSISKERLLGTLPKPTVNAPFLQMPTYSRGVCDFRQVSYDDIATVQVATFEVGVRKGKNLLDVSGVLRTGEPLAKLMQLSDFRLPGETRHDAERRHYA
jgi:hypothetical protein